MERMTGPADAEDAGNLQLDDRGVRWFRRHFAAATAVVTTEAQGAFRGATVTSALIASLTPLHLLVSIDLESQMNTWLEESGFFALNILPWQEQFLADQFAGFTPRAHPQFNGIDHSIATTGAPVLVRSIAWADCRILQTLESGDHQLFIGKAEQLGGGSGDATDPLLHFVNRYRRLIPGEIAF